jgi:hypothetical protein
MENIIGQSILSFMGITLNFSTGEIGWSSGTAGTAGVGASVDDWLLEDGTSHWLLESDATSVWVLE